MKLRDCLTFCGLFSAADMFQLCAAALVGVFLSMLIKEKSPNISVLLSSLCGAVILFSVAGDLSDIVSYVYEFSSFSGFESEILSVLLKVTGIAYIIDFSGDICRDAGENGIAKKLEFAGKISIIAISLPVIVSLFEKVKDVFI